MNFSKSNPTTLAGVSNPWCRGAKKVLTVLMLLAMGAVGFAQSNNGSIGGTVTDRTSAVIPNVTVTATNTNTGVVTEVTTNAAGVYQFASLQTGTYEVTAKSLSFQTATYKNVDLQINSRLGLDFSLEVATAQQAIEVNTSVDALREVSSTVGGVISNQKLQELPMTDLNALNLQNTMGGVSGTSFAGGQAASLNISRDGVSIVGERLGGTAVFTGVNIVDEIKVVVSPADAEFARGSGQVLISTKSGTNSFHGVVFGTLRNEALNANEFFANQRGLARPVLKREQFGVGVGGPIRRNQTFFYFLYDAQRQVSATTVTSTTLTSTARQGIFRFFPGVRNGNTTAAIPTVDGAGNPVTPAGATGPLQSFSVFGKDPARLTPDPTGVIQKLLALQPLPNDFRAGDGLNSAGYTWNRTTPSNRDQYNIRIDHNISQSQRLTGSYTRESTLGNYSSVAFPIKNGRGEGMNHLWNASLTSILSPSIVNQFSYGGKYATAVNGPANIWYPEEGYLPKSANGQDYGVATALITPTLGGAGHLNSVTYFVNGGDIYQYGDSLTVTRGQHTFKGGANWNYSRTRTVDGGTTGGAIPGAILPVMQLGAGGVPVTGVTNAAISGLGQNQAVAQNMLIDLTGSVASIVQLQNLNEATDKTFTPYLSRIRTYTKSEISWFFKDDWKVRSNLTLNLGVRWDYYGVPYDSKGLTAGLVGGSQAIFGISGTTWAAINRPGITGGALTAEELVGKNSPKPGTLPYGNDWNNFAPAVGLTWGIPYFGKDKTVLRVGYSINYPRSSTLGQVDSILGSTPGTNATVTYSTSQALNLANAKLPLVPNSAPLSIVPLTDRTQAQVAFDSGLRSPYVQNWNVSLDRQLPKTFVISVRYVGSKGTKLMRGIDVNTVNIFENGILDAFNTTAAGGNAPLFDRMFNGLNLGNGVVNGTTLTGSQALRASSATAPFLANNNVGGLANFINTTRSFTGVNGGLLRNGGFPENFIVANPQYVNAGLFGNYGNSSYNSAQVEITKRLSSGWTIFANYTFSKALGEFAGNGIGQYSDPRNWSRDKARLSFDQTHALKMNGTYELPFGPGKAILRGSGALAHVVGGWQTGGVLTLTSGQPISITSGSSTFTQAGSNAVAVGGLPEVRTVRDGNGVLFFPGLTQASDPGVARLAPAVAAISTQLALKDSKGNFVFVNPTAGTLGMSNFMLNGPKQFGLDVNLIKKIPVGERISADLRFDAIDVLNRPRFGNPNTNINSTSFGRITSSTGNRILVANLRIVF